ncbi:MAG: tol-pal system-associated acyl-CoA thioesterase [Gammaproteobacteria bacterium]|nr:MAG: tol-pal system-associated acyl-CoA thioesterase [Gammaproteobacteria bacterium]TLZ28164.1 MAG: tol-pal system-associated acyl-CoA thioesterase [Gammaproteobacteria bacterium]TLZ51963.1 MAG: tol-pal system-associated acyl-CoA thioesterase [Gammaproteobacteria bacterium]
MSVFRWPARVYWEDTDGGGIVYYANYLRFLERARSEWLRARGHSQLQLARDRGVVFTVVSLAVDYRAPARLDDELEITCEPRADGAASLRFAQRIYRAPAAGCAAQLLLLEASVRVACVDVRTMRPQRLPEFLASALAAEAPGSG